MHSGIIKILLCEDDLELRECVAQVLEASFNTSIRQCGTGLEAKEILNKETFDVVISDYDMGLNKGTGIDVFQHILKFGLECRFYLFTATLTDFTPYASHPIFKHIPKPDLVALGEELSKHFYDFKNSHY